MVVAPILFKESARNLFIEGSCILEMTGGFQGFADFYKFRNDTSMRRVEGYVGCYLGEVNILFPVTFFGVA